MDLLHHLAETGRAGGREAAKHLRRFEALLRRDGRDNGSILLQHCWALLHELRGDVAAAVPHREREIAYIVRLFRLGGGPHVGREWWNSLDDAYLARAMRTLRGHYVALGERDAAARLARRIRTVERRIARDAADRGPASGAKARG